MYTCSYDLHGRYPVNLQFFRSFRQSLSERPEELRLGNLKAAGILNDYPILMQAFTSDNIILLKGCYNVSKKKDNSAFLYEKLFNINVVCQSFRNKSIYVQTLQASLGSRIQQSLAVKDPKGAFLRLSDKEYLSGRIISSAILVR